MSDSDSTTATTTESSQSEYYEAANPEVLEKLVEKVETVKVEGKSESGESMEDPSSEPLAPEQLLASGETEEAEMTTETRAQSVAPVIRVQSPRKRKAGEGIGVQLRKPVSGGSPAKKAHVLEYAESESSLTKSKTKPIEGSKSAPTSRHSSPSKSKLKGTLSSETSPRKRKIDVPKETQSAGNSPRKRKGTGEESKTENTETRVTTKPPTGKPKRVPAKDKEKQSSAVNRKPGTSLLESPKPSPQRSPKRTLPSHDEGDARDSEEPLTKSPLKKRRTGKAPKPETEGEPLPLITEPGDADDERELKFGYVIEDEDDYSESASSAEGLVETPTTSSGEYSTPMTGMEVDILEEGQPAEERKPKEKSGSPSETDITRSEESSIDFAPPTRAPPVSDATPDEAVKEESKDKDTADEAEELEKD